MLCKWSVSLTKILFMVGENREYLNLKLMYVKYIFIKLI